MEAKRFPVSRQRGGQASGMGLPTARTSRIIAPVFSLLWLGGLRGQHARKRDVVVSPKAGDPATAANSASQKTWSALVVGNSQYQHTRVLKNPENDARDFGAFLGRSGYRVVVEQDLALERMQEAVSAFARGMAPGGRAVFFYAGHGVQIDGENYLIPIEFAAGNQEDARRKGFPLRNVLEVFAKAGISLGMAVVDACRNNPFKTQSRSLLAGLAPMEAPLGMMIALAASPGQTADDNPDGQNGLFTGSLLRTLSQPAPVSAAVRKARELVFQQSGGKQRPWIHDDVIGDFTFAAAMGQQSPEPPEQRLDMLQDGIRTFGSGDLTAAAEQFERARRAQPSNPYAHNAAGATWARLGNLAIAVECYSRAIELKPDYASAYLNRGMVYLKAGKYSDARQDFDWALAENEEDPVLLRLRGEANLRLRKYEEAEKDFAGTIGLDPTDPHAHVGLGVIAERRGRFTLALAEYRKALSLRPGMQEATRRLADVTSRLNQE